jgi:hypothetical protein
MEVGAVGPNFERDTHLITISAIFFLIWLSGLRGEDLNVKIYDERRMDGRTYERRTSSDVNNRRSILSSPGERPVELLTSLEVRRSYVRPSIRRPS